MLAKIGHGRPPFALLDQNGRNATPLEDNVMGDPVLLVFDRNDVQGGLEDTIGLLRALVGLHERLKGLVATIFVISRRSVDENLRLAQAEYLPFGLLADEDGKVFQAYGIDLADAPENPASVVVDSNGRVILTCEQMKIAEQVEGAFSCLQRLDAQRPRGALGLHPPVLVVPNAMDGGICERLIDTWHNPVPLFEGDGQVAIAADSERGDIKVHNAVYGNVVQYLVRDPELSRELDQNVMGRVAPERKCPGLC